MLIIGCGYVGLRVARHRIAQGEPVWALTRCERRAAEFRAEGIQPLVGDITDPSSLGQLSSAGMGEVLFAVGYDRKQAATIQQVYVDGLRAFLERLAADGAALDRIIYLSSTGVYGDSQGAWVDETTPCEPEREGGRACLDAETLLETHPLTCDNHIILRLAGIYGTDRVPRLGDIRAGLAMAAPPNTWLNLIHVDDIVTIIDRMLQTPSPDRFCVSDGHPIRRHDYYRLIAELAEAPPITWSSQPLAGGSTIQRSAADKRVSNQKLRQWLSQQDMELKHPDCRSGLAAIIAEATHG